MCFKEARVDNGAEGLFRIKNYMWFAGLAAFPGRKGKGAAV